MTSKSGFGACKVHPCIYTIAVEGRGQENRNQLCMHAGASNEAAILRQPIYHYSGISGHMFMVFWLRVG